LTEATEDLDYLRSLQRGEPQAQIVGKIGQQTAEIKKSKNFSFNDWFFFGSPVIGVKVFAKGENQTYETFSDTNGEYKFFGLPTGDYEIWADYPSYFESRKVSVVTKAQGCGIGNIKAWRKGSISGRVIDANGAIVSDVPISLVSADARPEEILEERKDETVWNFAVTNKKGEYYFSMLPAGRYFLIINRTEFERTRGSEQTQKIPRLFYPGAKSHKETTIISIEEGEQVEKKDFRLPKSE
jgi:hypothetical protein